MKIKVTLVRSSIGRPKEHRKILQTLGLNKIGSSSVHEDSPAIQGMIQKCSHLVNVETVAE